MQFSVAAVAFLATMVSAQSVVYETDVITVTDCAPTVTDCPAHSTKTSVTSYAVTHTPVYVNSTSVYVPEHTATETPMAPPAETSHVSLSTLTISTCVPTVIYSTVTVVPTTTAVYVPSSNATAPLPTGTGSVYPTKPVDFTGAASSMQGSALAAVLGLAAFVLA